MEYFNDKRKLQKWVKVNYGRWSEDFFWTLGLTADYGFLEREVYSILLNGCDPYYQEFIDEFKVPEKGEIWVKAYILSGEYPLPFNMNLEQNDTQISFYLFGATNLWYQYKSKNTEFKEGELKEASRIYPYKIPRNLNNFRVTIDSKGSEIGFTRAELDRFIKVQTQTPETQEPKAQTEPTGAHLAIIGAMLQLLTTGKDNKSKDVFKANNNQNSIADAIATFSTDYETHTGLSATRAKEIFAEANKYLKSKRK